MILKKPCDERGKVEVLYINLSRKRMKTINNKSLIFVLEFKWNLIKLKSNETECSCEVSYIHYNILTKNIPKTKVVELFKGSKVV
jgi:hypothetical protein